MKSVQEVSKQALKHKVAGPHPKSDVRYWQGALFQTTYTKAGRTCRVRDWAVKIQFKGRRETFNLGTPNKAAAACLAKEVYLCLRGAGWETALAKFKPSLSVPYVTSDVANVGEFIAEVTAKATVAPLTIKGYANAFRKIVADIQGIDGGKSKFDHATGGTQKWLDQINAVSLSDLTPDLVQRWKLDFVSRAGRSPIRVNEARNSANSFLRNARSLFSPKMLKFARVKLPDLLPFVGVQFEPRSSMRYHSSMNASDLVSLAQAELAETRAEEFKIFLLAVMAGLRRSEIDLLEWPAFNFSQAVIRIRVTEHFKPKSVDSIGDVVIDDQVNRIFLEYEKKKVGTFVIESENPPRPDAICQYYRCDKIFKALLAWLRLKGILTDKPLHTLRKEFGSLLCERGGIYEASRALRHADIRTTSAHYLDSKRRVTVGLGDSLVKHDR